MAMKIRLARGGAKKNPFYRIVVAANTAPRDGKFKERVGSYNPMLPTGHADRFVIKEDRIKYWMSVGAKPTIRVQKLLATVGLAEAVDYSKQTKKPNLKAKAQQRVDELKAKQEEEAAASAEETPAEEQA